MQVEKTKKICRALNIAITHFTPVIKNTVFFDSFWGQYNDNPKYISEELHRIDPSISIVWSVSLHGHDRPPEYAKQVITGSRDYYKYAYNSIVTVDNYTGLRTFGFVNACKKLFSYLAKKRGQLSISTWHGTPLKKIGNDYLQKPKAKYCSGTTYCLAGCEYDYRILEQAFQFSGLLRLYGTPRNDLLFTDQKTIQIKKKLGLPIDKKIVLFAPTFRESVEMSGISQLKEINTDTLLKKLSQKLGGDFVFVFRVHHRVLEEIEKQSVSTKNERIINGNIHDDMAEYLYCCDVLISDYSGSIFDFLITGRPCFLYCPDWQKYSTKERGTYMDLKELPFSVAQNFDELINNIANYRNEIYKHDIEKFKCKIGDAEDGQASKRVAYSIINFMKNGEVK